MSAAPKKHNEASLSAYVGISLLVHVAAILYITVKAVFFPSDDVLIQSALRVDMVALPDKVESPSPTQAAPSPKVEVPQPAPKALPKPVPTKTPAINIKKKQNAAIERLKALEAIENIRNEIKEPQKANTKTPQYKGNVVTKGDDLTGLDRMQYDGYFSKLKSQVKQNWQVPQWLSESQLKTQIQVTFDAQGMILDKKIVISSGNAVFDRKALEAIERSAPLPIPPEKLQSLMEHEGILFNFP